MNINVKLEGKFIYLKINFVYFLKIGRLPENVTYRKQPKYLKFHLRTQRSKNILILSLSDKNIHSEINFPKTNFDLNSVSWQRPLNRFGCLQIICNTHAINKEKRHCYIRNKFQIVRENSHKKNKNREISTLMNQYSKLKTMKLVKK